MPKIPDQHTIERQLGTDGPAPSVTVTIHCQGHYRDPQRLELRQGRDLVVLDRAELYALVDAVAVADPEEWARRFLSEVAPADQLEAPAGRPRRPPFGRLDPIQQVQHLRHEHGATPEPPTHDAEADATARAMLHLAGHPGAGHDHEDVDPDA